MTVYGPCKHTDRVCRRIHGPSMAVYTARVQLYNTCTRPLHRHVHGVHGTCTRQLHRRVQATRGRLHGRVRAVNTAENVYTVRVHVFGRVSGPYTAAYIAVYSLCEPVNRSAYWSCTRPVYTACVHDCVRTVCTAFGRVHSAYTAADTPPCTGRVHRRVHEHVHGRVRAVYAVVYTAGVHGHVHGRVRAVYRDTGCVSQCITTVLFAKDTIYAKTYSYKSITFKTRNVGQCPT